MPTKKPAFPCRTENQEQKMLCDWMTCHGLLYAHVPNQSGGVGEASQRAITQAKLKRIGLKPGFPDLLVFDAPPSCPQYVGVAIELKRRKGSKASLLQLCWLEDLERRGWAARVCHGADDAIAWLESLGWGL